MNRKQLEKEQRKMRDRQEKMAEKIPPEKSPETTPIPPRVTPIKGLSPGLRALPPMTPEEKKIMREREIEPYKEYTASEAALLADAPGGVYKWVGTRGLWRIRGANALGRGGKPLFVGRDIIRYRLERWWREELTRIEKEDKKAYPSFYAQWQMFWADTPLRWDCDLSRHMRAKLYRIFPTGGLDEERRERSAIEREWQESVEEEKRAAQRQVVADKLSEGELVAISYDISKGKIYPVDEVAALFRVSRQRVLGWCSRGKLIGVQIQGTGSCVRGESLYKFVVRHWKSIR
jgi:hypothetical protein